MATESTRVYVVVAMAAAVAVVDVVVVANAVIVTVVVTIAKIVVTVRNASPLRLLLRAISSFLRLILPSFFLCTLSFPFLSLK
jgi:hypothetical protein